MNAGILGLGSCVPSTVLTNSDIVAMNVDTSDEWIVDRTGIHERRVLDSSQNPSDLAVAAAKIALIESLIDANQIDLIVVATSTPDFAGFPSTAAIVQKELGCRLIPAFDVSAACSGFNYALTVAEQFIKTGACRYALVIGADALTRALDWTDRTTCILFGDGAGAAVIGPVSDGFGILRSHLGANGNFADVLTIPRSTGKILMNGKAVFKLATQTIVTAIQDVLLDANLTIDDISWIFPHQANWRILHYISEKLGFPMDKIGINLDRYGNTSAASIPMLWHEMSPRLQCGDLVILAGFGSGFTWGVNLIRWQGEK